MSNQFTIDRALTDPRLLGAALDDISTWSTWVAVLKAAFALPLTDSEQQLFAQVAGKRPPPTERVRELWANIGRRGGKSQMAAALAVYLACFIPHRLSRGETGMVLVLAASREQAGVVFKYALGFLEASPVLRQEVESRTASEIRLTNGITIAVHAKSFRSVRGRTLIAVILDEIGFWRDEVSAEPDVETYRAILPSLATTMGMLIGISTPYRRLGLLYTKFRQHYGQPSDDILVVRGDTRTFNPTISEDEIAAQRQADPTGAISEWDAEFRADISQYLDDALIENAIDYGRPLECPPIRNVYPAPSYTAFTDAAAGTGRDSYTLCVGHAEGEPGSQARYYVIDLVRGTSGTYDPDTVTQEYAKVLREYHITSVHGDAYAREWVAGAWQKAAITYHRSQLPKSELYPEAAPLFARGQVRLPNHPQLLKEFRLLERRTHRSGRDTVDHGPSGHDDHANAVAGVLYQMSSYLRYDLAALAGADETLVSYTAAQRFRSHLLACGAPWEAVYR